MSYNIDNVDTQVLKAWMYAQDVVSLHKKLESELAEINFLEDMVDDATQALTDGAPTKEIRLPNISWCGEGSGRSFEEVLVSKIAPKIMGRVEAICTWEGGDSTSAFIISDGEYEECDLEVKIVRKPKVPKKPRKVK